VVRDLATGERRDTSKACVPIAVVRGKRRRAYGARPFGPVCGLGDQGEPEMADTSDLLAREYEAINAHLRANIGQFVNWFSFFLTFSFAALAVFVATGDRWPQPRLLSLGYAVPAAFLLLHMLAFGAILTFRHYIADADRRVVRSSPGPGWLRRSPIPVRFCKWMTNFMAAGFLVSYFGWLLLFFVH
jgi:hypothetical protein